MANIRPAPCSWNTTEKPFIHKDLISSPYVFVRNDKIKSSVTPPYDGPYKVTERYEKYFTVLITDKPTKISIDRLKPAYIAQSETVEHRSADSSYCEDTPSMASPQTDTLQTVPSQTSDVQQPDTSSAAPTIQPRTTRSGRVIKFPVRYT